ncbi:MAG: hypothetical protein V4502_03125 [Pseudomonadota bacterium]
MLMKIGGLARALYVLLAIVAAFVALTMMNVPLVLVVLGLVAGLAIGRDKLALVMIAVVALPLIGAALANLPTVGAQLAAICANLQLGAAGSAATALAIYLYEMVMETLTGLVGGTTAGKPAAATR